MSEQTDDAGFAAEQAQHTAPDDQAMLTTIGRKYKALAPFIGDAAVMQSPDPGDGRQLEFYHPGEPDNPRPGKPTFEFFKPMAGDEREDAVAADALHYLGGTQQPNDKGAPVDPQWSEMRDQLWNMRSPQQRKMDETAFEEEKERGDTPDAWANRSRKDAYVRAGIFPHRNPEWNLPEGDPEGWTPEQRAHVAAMRSYLVNGEVVPMSVPGDPAPATALPPAPIASTQMAPSAAEKAKMIKARMSQYVTPTGAP